jgi:cupin 2 domain-containing protein
MSEIPVNLLSNLPRPAEGEVFEELLRRGAVRIERIVSSARPESTLYDQVQDEWVLLIQGEARLWVAGRELDLKVGDSLFLPARTPHRVLATSADPLCVWIAVHTEGVVPGG